MAGEGFVVENGTFDISTFYHHGENVRFAALESGSQGSRIRSGLHTEDNHSSFHSTVTKYLRLGNLIIAMTPEAGKSNRKRTQTAKSHLPHYPNIEGKGQD